MSADTQRRALKLITGSIFMPQSFTMPADFQRKLVPDNLERSETGASVEFDLPDRVSAVQAIVLGRIYDEDIARRLAEYGDEGDAKHPAFTLGELYASVQAAVWAEAARGGETTLVRRNLQREQLKHLVVLLTRPGRMSADAIALARDNARELLTQLQRAGQHPGLSRETRAHYADSAATLQEALKASYNRVG